MSRVKRLLPIVAFAGLGASAGARAETSAASGAAPASAMPSASSASSAGAKAQEPTEIEVIDLNPEPPRDPQRIAIGGQLGPMWMTSGGSGAGTFALDFALVGSFGVSTAGARVPFTIDAWVAAAIVQKAFGLTSDASAAPDRFTELGVRLVFHREPAGTFSWVSLGGGLAWTSARISQDPRCADVTAAHAAGVSCDAQRDISPAFMVEAGFGLYEWLSHTKRIGFGLRIPAQLSSAPGIGAVLAFYGQIGLQR